VRNFVEKTRNGYTDTSGRSQSSSAARNVADKAVIDRVANGYEGDWNRLRHLLHGARSRGAGYDHRRPSG
jgi:hypothetical protein